MTVAVKICGVSDVESVEIAVTEGADYLGFNFFEASPRYVTAAHAASLLDGVPDDVAKVGVFVDPDPSLLDDVLGQTRLDYIQLHGRETPERIDAIRLAYGVPVIKAIGVADAEDLEVAAAFFEHADCLLFDAKPPPGAARPGGNALAFPWSLMKHYSNSTPWLLAGGLTPDTVGQAIKESGAQAVDVSSGVESAPGKKDPALITAFLRAAKHGKQP